MGRLPAQLKDWSSLGLLQPERSDDQDDLPMRASLV